MGYPQDICAIFDLTKNINKNYDRIYNIIKQTNNKNDKYIMLCTVCKVT